MHKKKLTLNYLRKMSSCYVKKRPSKFFQNAQPAAEASHASSTRLLAIESKY